MFGFSAAIAIWALANNAAANIEANLSIVICFTISASTGGNLIRVKNFPDSPAQS
jgi:hypothetical protein